MHQHEEARNYADGGSGYRLFSVVFFELWVPVQERCLIQKSGVVVRGGGVYASNFWSRRMNTERPDMTTGGAARAEGRR
jgi:hypothetical protein